MRQISSDIVWLYIAKDADDELERSIYIMTSAWLNINQL
jgi:hypothetical protein